MVQRSSWIFKYSCLLFWHSHKYNKHMDTHSETHADPYQLDVDMDSSFRYADNDIIRAVRRPLLYRIPIAQFVRGKEQSWVDEISTVSS